MSEAAVCRLEDLGLLCFRGPDAGKFLQGQLSNDVAALTPGVLLRAGLNTPQGRAVALLALAAVEGAILALLPGELLAIVQATLSRYVLRSKVTISDASAEYRLYGVLGEARAASAASYVYDGARALVIASADAAPPGGTPLARERWRALDIAAGLAQLYSATSGQFVAQMLNLDCIGAVSFSKGCYTGQEVIARAHYRGRVKRRMQRFLSVQPVRLKPGDSGQLSDGRAYRVIEAVEHADGGVEFLAVAPLPPTSDEQARAALETEPASAPGSVALEVRELALPYPLPG